MINLTIDGKAIQAEQGTTVLEAAKANGIRIPHLCYHPAIKPIGSCRICVVEVKPGPPRPLPACTTVVGEGMEVVTNSERIQKIRRELVKFMLVNHPLDCPWCDKGGECYLQDLTHELAVGEVDYEAVAKPENNDLASPLIERYNSRCVTCGRCVRTCRDLVGASAINFENRAYFTDLGSGHEPLDCEFCGSCIDSCPVGALINKQFKYAARSWELTETETVCSFCGGGCEYLVHTKDGKVRRVRSKVENLLLCGRGRFGYEVVHSPERLTSPLIKKDGKLTPVSWDEAINFAVQGLEQIIAKGGRSAVFGVGSARATNEANYLFHKFFRAAIGSNQVDNPARYTYMKALEGMAAVFGKPMVDGVAEEVDKLAKPFQSPLKLTEEATGSGFPFVMGCRDHLHQADVVLVVGADVTPEMPPYGWKIQKALLENENFKLIVANPRETKHDKFAGIKLRYQPGSERLLLKGLMEAVLEAVPGFTPPLEAEGFEDIKTDLMKTSLSEVAKTTGVGMDELRAAGAILAQAQAPAIIFGNDLLAQAGGKENAMAVANLFLMIGQPCNPGSGLYPVAEKNNTRGVCEVGVLPDHLPGLQPLDAAPAFAAAWKANVPAEPGLTLPVALAKLAAGEPTAPQAFYLLGGDLVRMLPNSKQVAETLNKAKFIVVQDAFLTEAARMADVVFPVAIHAERGGTVVNTDGRLGRLKSALTTEGVRPDWQIISALAGKMGYAMSYRQEEDIFREMAALMPIWAEAEAGHRWPVKKIAGTVKGAFAPLSIEVESPGEGDFTLIVGKTLVHSGSYTTQAPGQIALLPGLRLQINPATAGKLDLKDGETVKIVSTQGEITTPVAYTTAMPATVVFLADAFAEPTANVLTLNSNIMRVKLQKG